MTSVAIVYLVTLAVLIGILFAGRGEASGTGVFILFCVLIGSGASLAVGVLT